MSLCTATQQSMLTIWSDVHKIWQHNFQVDKLEEAGVKKVVCIAVADPEEVSKWADKVGLTGTKIEVWADTKGAWTRMLGLDVNQYDEPGPRSHRYNTAHVANIHITGCS